MSEIENSVKKLPSILEYIIEEPRQHPNELLNHKYW